MNVLKRGQEGIMIGNDQPPWPPYLAKIEIETIKPSLPRDNDNLNGGIDHSNPRRITTEFLCFYRKLF